MVDDADIHEKVLHAEKPMRRRNVEIGERRAQVLEQRKLGLSYRDIAARLSVDPKTVWNDEHLALKAMLQQPAEDVRKMELERLDFLWQHAIAIVVSSQSTPDVRLRAIETCARLMKRRAEMLGIDAAQKVDLTSWVIEFGRQQGLDPADALETADEIVKAMGF